MRRLRTVGLLACAVLAAPLHAQSPINFLALEARRDSFAVTVQGNVLGFQRTIVERTESGFRITDDVVIGTIMTQRTEIDLAPDGAMRWTQQTGRVRGQDTRIDIMYAGGRAKGTAMTPSATGGQTITFDTTLAPGTIDDNLITVLLPVFAWSPGATFTVPVFLSGKGEVHPLTLSAKVTESLTVPAGTFEVYRVEILGGSAPVAMYVTTTAPHRLIKVAPEGAPLEFVLAK